MIVCLREILHILLDTNIFTCFSNTMDGKMTELDKNLEILPQKRSFRKALFIISYLGAVPLFLFFLVLFSLAIKYESSGIISRQDHKPKYQAIPSDSLTSDIAVQNEDGRVEALDEFFAEYKSPLHGHAKTIVDEADSHNIDYRFLPAIAMQESTLCKKIIKESFNCWGFGIYGGKVTRFESYDQAIKVVTATLAKKYVNQGLTSPEEIVKKYTPSDTGKWSDVVSLIMTRLKASI